MDSEKVLTPTPDEGATFTIGTAISGEKSNALDAEGLTLAASFMANHPQLILPTCLLPNIVNYTLVFLMTLWI